MADITGQALPTGPKNRRRRENTLDSSGIRCANTSDPREAGLLFIRQGGPESAGNDNSMSVRLEILAASAWVCGGGHDRSDNSPIIRSSRGHSNVFLIVTWFKISQFEHCYRNHFGPLKT
jgi:hypothetical protein